VGIGDTHIHANDHPGGAGITITYQDWDNAADMRRVLEPFKDATEALEGDYIALPLVPCIMSVLDSHIEAEIAAFVSGSSSANATEVMLLDHSDRWDELPNVVKIAAALSARTKGLEWLDATERTCGAALFSWSVRSCSKRTSPRKCGRGARPTESEVTRNAVWTGERHPRRSRRRDDF